MVNISVWGVILAALSAMVVGTVWYSKAVFGKRWMKVLGMSDKDMKKNMPFAMTMMIVAALLTSYTLAHFIIYAHRGTNNSWEWAAIKTSLWAWLGFSFTTVIAHDSWDNRTKKNILINAGNRLVTLLVMGLILGAFLK
jgi:sterol desaturase/sphingolipid hydroxylase (fatty acid hydroxylase superfamily)